jgi:hypothetical protein
MGHDEPGQAAQLAGDGPGDEHFGDGVQAGGGVVKYQQPRRAGVRERAGKTEPLHLAAGQRGAVERSVQLPGQAGEEGGGLGLPGGRADLRVVRTAETEPDDVKGSVADEFGAFEGVHHRFAQGCLRELAQVGPVEEHRARVGIGEPPGEPRQG